MLGGIAFNVVWSGFSMIFVLVGLFIANRGRKARNRGKLIEGTKTTEVRELTPGKAEVKGKAGQTEDGSTVRSPIDRDEALASKVKIEEYHSNSDGGGSWKSIYENSKAVPFILEDKTGEVRIDPPPESERQINIEANQKEVGGGEEPPEKIKDFIRRKKEVDSAKKTIGPLNFGQRRRYSEGRIESGESVYVLGKATEEDTGWGEYGYAIDEPTSSGRFILSDKSEERLVKETKWGGALMLIFGGIFALFGAVFVISPWIFF